MTLDWPYAEGRGRPASRRGERRSPLVLVVEDHKLNSVLMRDTLQSYGYRVLIAHDAPEAIRLTWALRPDIILMDEPASALDPHATAHLEAMIDGLREKYCIVIITHNMQQAARVSQRAAFFHLGELLEVGDTKDIFIRPQNDLCRDYITGRFG